jgi:hypothetical protein
LGERLRDERERHQDGQCLKAMYDRFGEPADDPNGGANVRWVEAICRHA